MVGDHRLGGIGSTISAFESLHVRGYDVDSVVLFEDETYRNFEYLRDHFEGKSIEAFSLQQVPLHNQSKEVDNNSMNEYYENVSKSKSIDGLLQLIDRKHHRRISKLSQMPALTESVIWHPFRQHSIPHDLLVVDSAFGDHFQSLNKKAVGLAEQADFHQPSGISQIRQGQPEPLLEPLFDGSASWWTQGLGHGNSDLALTAAHGAGRYGHVMSASAIHAPALELATNLISLLGNPRLSRVFYSDNGSTGVEVGLKMALRSSAKRYGWTRKDGQLGVLGLRGSYHGDCIATMNCCEPSTYNETVNWYQPWGWWFDPPSLKFSGGAWVLKAPTELLAQEATFTNLADVFDFEERRRLGHTQLYERFILTTLERLICQEGRKFGALICEPILMGAGGMISVDPLFQRTLIKVVREMAGSLYGGGSTSTMTGNHSTDWSGLPIIADEVLTGLYRLGRASSSSFLSMNQSARHVDNDIAPDISVHAKLLTGGLLPLAVTTASNPIFETFLSDKKEDALLHGHSYTAHAVGCSVAEKSLASLRTMEKNGAWQVYQNNWRSDKEPAGLERPSETDFWSFWSYDSVKRIAESSQVEGVFALGSVLVINMKTGAEKSGYTSNAAQGLQAALLKVSPHGFGVHSRVLGNVLYLMASMTSQAGDIAAIEKSLLRALI